MKGLFSRRSIVLAALVMSLALAGMTRASWTTALASGFTGAEQTVDVTGQQAAPAVLALALVGAAAAIATTLGSRWVRFATGPVMIVVGAGAVISALGAQSDAVGASRSAVAEATGVVGGSVDAEPTVWPLLALIPAVLLVLLGVLVLAVGGRWPQRRSRYQRDAARARAARDVDPTADPAAAWDALSRGEDPSEAGDDTRTPPPDDPGRVAE
jgi:uncharacterized membrane protein (TIGR02234 family)